jgi:hypothetical protein
MKILVTIDEVEAFRLGFNAPSDEIELDLDPEIFTAEERNYIAAYSKDGKFQGPFICPPDLDGFIDAVHRGIKLHWEKENDAIPF